MVDLVDSTGYFREGGESLGKEAKRRHSEITSKIFKKYNLKLEPPQGDGYLFWGKDPVKTCLAAIDVIKRIKTEVIHHSTEDKQYNLATKIVLTKGLIESSDDEKNLIHGEAAHKCKRILDAARQKHHTVLIDSTIYDEIKNHLNETDIIYSGPFKLDVDEFGSIDVYQIADKELGLKIDPIRIKLRNQIKNEVKDLVDDKIKEIRKKQKIAAPVRLVIMSLAVAILFSSLVYLLVTTPDFEETLLQNEIEFTKKTLATEVKNAAFMIYETSKNDIMKQPLLTTHTENFPIMMPETSIEEKPRIDLIKTVVDGMDVLHYLFIVPPENWSEKLQCRLYVIYPVGALIPGEAPDFLKARDWCDNKANFEMYQSSAYYSRGQKQIVSTMIIPIFDDSLKKVGYLAGAVDFNKILRTSIENSKITNVGYILVDHDNCVVASTYKTELGTGNVVNFRELYEFNSGVIENAPTEVTCNNEDSILNPNGYIKTTFDQNNQFNSWKYNVNYLNKPKIIKPDIDTNNILEDWKLIVIQPE